MATRRAFLAQVLGTAVVVTSGLAACSSGSADDSGSDSGHVEGATAITKVYGDGQKFVAVAVLYDADIDTAKLSTSDFKVDGRTVTKVYANTSATLAAEGVNGKYVIVELSPDDDGAALWGNSPPSGGGSQSAGAQPSGGPQSGTASSGTAGPPMQLPAATLKTPKGSVTQVASVTTIGGTDYAASSTAVATSKTVNLIVDDFKQFTFRDPKTGQTLNYNLYIPKNYDKSKSYPLVLFMHDSSVVNTATKATLVQGLGAVCWASPEDQAKREAFVVAPQYPSVVVEDDYQPTALFDATVNLVTSLTTQYSIDTNRLYATGQSMGGMMALGMNIKYPDLFAASYVVAGQWPTAQTAPLAKKNLWIVVAQGDAKAYPGENAITAFLETKGAKVSTAVWNGKATAAQFAANVKAMEAKATPINYASFVKGSVLAAGESSQGAAEHTSTWKVAYSIDGVRDWIFEQHK